MNGSEEKDLKYYDFWNNELLKNIDGELEEIRNNCLNHPPLTPPIKGGETNRGSSHQGRWKSE